MKKIIIFLIFGFISLYAKPCMTDIYFGNGVWNTEKEAIYSKNRLRDFMLFGANILLDIQKEGETYTFKHAYNPSTGTQADLIETFWQLRESGQIDEGYFQMIASTLAAQNGATTHEEVLAQIHNVIAYYNYNTSTMYDIYQSESFNQRHNVLLVAHSQGNLFGNKMYTLMSDTQKSKFRMVSVATPADHVAGGGPYVTAAGDYVINPIPGALPSNVDGIGHTFIGTYLNSSINAPRKIALYVKSAYDSLSQSSTCGGKYDYIRIGFVQTRLVSVVGHISGTNDVNQSYEYIGSVAIPSYVPSNGICGSEYVAFEGEEVQIVSEYAATYSLWLTHLWNIGTIHSIDELEEKQDATYKFFDHSRCYTVKLDLDGELYDLALSAFNEENNSASDTDPTYDPIYMYKD